MDNRLTPREHLDLDTGELWEELPREEALVRFYTLRNRFGGTTALLWASTECARHRLEHGHDLAPGCCRDVTVAAPAAA